MKPAEQQLDLSKLSPTARRELRDFYQFLLMRSAKTKDRRATGYQFADLCGKLAWTGDAVATQRGLRDEW